MLRLLLSLLVWATKTKHCRCIHRFVGASIVAGVFDKLSTGVIRRVHSDGRNIIRIPPTLSWRTAVIGYVHTSAGGLLAISIRSGLYGVYEHLQYFVSHRRLNVDFHLRARQNVDVDDISERLELRFGLRFAGVIDVSIELSAAKGVPPRGCRK